MLYSFVLLLAFFFSIPTARSVVCGPYFVNTLEHFELQKRTSQKIESLLHGAKNAENWDYDSIMHYNSEIINEVKILWDAIGVKYQVSPSGNSLILSNIDGPHPLNSQSFIQYPEIEDKIQFEFSPLRFLIDTELKRDLATTYKYGKHRYFLSYEEAINSFLNFNGKVFSPYIDVNKDFETFKVNILNNNKKSTPLHVLKIQKYLDGIGALEPMSLWSQNQKNKFTEDFIGLAEDFLKSQKIDYSISEDVIYLKIKDKENPKVEFVFDVKDFFMNDKSDYHQHFQKSYREGRFNIPLDVFLSKSFLKFGGYAEYQLPILSWPGFWFQEFSHFKKKYSYWIGDKFPNHYQLKAHELFVLARQFDLPWMQFVDEAKIKGVKLIGDYKKFFNDKEIFDMATWSFKELVSLPGYGLVGLKKSPIRFLEREQGSNLYVFNYLVDNNYQPPNFLQTLPNFVDAVEDKYLAIAPEWVIHRDQLFDFYNNPLNRHRSQLFFEMEESIFENGNLKIPNHKKFASGVVVIMNTKESLTLPLDLAFDEPLHLEYRNKAAAEITKAFDFFSKLKKYDPSSILTKYLRMITHFTKRHVEVFYVHAFGAKHLRYYTSLGGEIEKISLPFINGEFDFSYIEKNKQDLLKIEKFRNFWERIKKSPDTAIQDGLIIKPSRYNKVKDKPFEPDLIMRVFHSTLEEMIDQTY